MFYLFWIFIYVSTNFSAERLKKKIAPRPTGPRPSRAAGPSPRSPPRARRTPPPCPPRTPRRRALPPPPSTPPLYKPRRRPLPLTPPPPRTRPAPRRRSRSPKAAAARRTPPPEPPLATPEPPEPRRPRRSQPEPCPDEVYLAVVAGFVLKKPFVLKKTLDRFFSVLLFCERSPNRSF